MLLLAPTAKNYSSNCCRIVHTFVCISIYKRLMGRGNARGGGGGGDEVVRSFFFLKLKTRILRIDTNIHIQLVLV